MDNLPSKVFQSDSICVLKEIYMCEYDHFGNILSEKRYDSIIGYYTITNEIITYDEKGNWLERNIKSTANKFITTQKLHITYY
jgi:hypothetical protein